MAVEKTLLIVKPDGVRRGLVGEVISRVERKGLKIVKLRMLYPRKECIERLYDIHKGKPFYEELVSFMTSGPIVAMVVEGDEAVSVVRTLIGPTDGRKAPPGTIRGDFALSISYNVVHAADSAERAKYEIG
ncbi:MAG: nucleoside-diphosphate kinase, partial [Desulfurococcales archaeon]|nr:nucleoside-diphosphate kinase [Desulfurococcales archaeon]